MDGKNAIYAEEQDIPASFTNMIKEQKAKLEALIENTEKTLSVLLIYKS